MRILLLGYGKMGKVIEQVATQRGHQIVGTIDLTNRADLKNYSPHNTDVVIEFSAPEAAHQNLQQTMAQGLRVVCGTTGWLAHRPEIETLCQQYGAAFFYASNYSIGVNLFFRLNKALARMMQPYQNDYGVTMTEVHHTQKLDSPSGTAITLAEGILENLPLKTKWVGNSGAAIAEDEIEIVSLRQGDVPGTHVVKYESAVDSIEISHVAHSRAGFALGAVVAAEFLNQKTGVYGMDELLGAPVYL